MGRYAPDVCRSNGRWNIHAAALLPLPNKLSLNCRFHFDFPDKHFGKTFNEMIRSSHTILLDHIAFAFGRKAFRPGRQTNNGWWEFRAALSD
jgi:hypothetical protein